MSFRFQSFRAIALCMSFAAPATMYAQAPAAAASSARQSGTVKSVEGTTLTVTTAAGATVTVTLARDAMVLQVPAGSSDLKAATPGALSDVSVGDRVITGKAGDTDTASRVIVMKSGDIAARKASQQADWQRNGTGGLVREVDGPVLTMASGTRTEKVQTTASTIFRRYANDSVKFEDATSGTLDQIRAGDQISVRGTKSADGTSIEAAEVVTGTFHNLSGALSVVNSGAGTLTLKDLISKKTVTVKVTGNSDLRKLPAQAAAMFAARSSGAGAGGEGAGARAGGAGAASGGAGPGAGGGRARAGMDLSRMLARLPAESLSDLKAGDAVMIVASESGGTDQLTAITLLSGVEQLLSAPAGSQPITLSPWTLGVPEAGGGGPQ